MVISSCPHSLVRWHLYIEFLTINMVHAYDSWRINLSSKPWNYENEQSHNDRKSNNDPCLTHWGRVAHICVSKIITIGSDNDLSPGRCQAITWTNAEILLIGLLGINFSAILIEINAFLFKKMHLKKMLIKWYLFCLSLDEFTKYGHVIL